MQHVTVTAEPGIARPFPTGEDDKFIVLGELSGKLVEVLPKCRGDLEVIALMNTNIKEGFVAGKIIEIPRRVCADGFFRLAVQITPIGQQIGLCCHPHGIRCAYRIAVGINQINGQITRRTDAQSIDYG